MNKLFRNGISLHPFVDLRYESQNFVGKDLTDVDFGGQGIEPVSNGRIGFDVDLPLLRNRGRSAVAAGEIAAGFDLEASRLQLLFQQSESVLTTVQAYWQARAAADQVEVLRRSVEIQGELSTATRSMIAANEKPRSDEARVLASTADARSRYEAAQRQLNDARIALAQSMGVALADALSIPLAADPYPQPPPDIQFIHRLYAAFIRDAMVKRFDRQAALRAESSGKALVTGAQLDTTPAARRCRLGLRHQRAPGRHRLREVGVQERQPSASTSKSLSVTTPRAACSTSASRRSVAPRSTRRTSSG